MGGWKDARGSSNTAAPWILRTHFAANGDLTFGSKLIFSAYWRSHINIVWTFGKHTRVSLTSARGYWIHVNEHTMRDDTRATHTKNRLSKLRLQSPPDYYYYYYFRFCNCFAPGHCAIDWFALFIAVSLQSRPFLLSPVDTCVDPTSKNKIKRNECVDRFKLFSYAFCTRNSVAWSWCRNDIHEKESPFDVAVKRMWIVSLFFFAVLELAAWCNGTPDTTASQVEERLMIARTHRWFLCANGWIVKVIYRVNELCIFYDSSTTAQRPSHELNLWISQSKRHFQRMSF